MADQTDTTTERLARIDEKLEHITSELVVIKEQDRKNSEDIAATREDFLKAISETREDFLRELNKTREDSLRAIQGQTRWGIGVGIALLAAGITIIRLWS